MQTLSGIDYLIFIGYFLIVAGYGYYVYIQKKSTVTLSKDYFLAEGSLTWWAIGASLIASNISAEQMIGMSGSGFKIGLAIATYEWMGAATLLIVAIFFMPIYLRNQIYTMPEFLRRRYNDSVAMIMSVFWLVLYTVVNLTSILYLGAIAISSISGFSITICMIGLAFFAILITLGGMKVIGYTDVIQVFFLILGGLATTYLALNLVAESFGDTGTFRGLQLLLQQADSHFHMILKKGDESYLDLPGLTVLLGGMWIVNLNYWGCNQYITQRALGADLKTAREGLLFAAGLKILMPVIVCLPGIAAYLLYQKGYFSTSMVQDGSVNPDKAYPVLLSLLPAGLKGLSFAALTAAVVASLAGKANSIATIFTLDIYKGTINKNASESQLVKIGKLVIILVLVVAVIIAPFLGIDKKGGFAYIQEYTGFVSPGIFAMFFLGFFWKRTTANAALFAIIGGFLCSVALKFLPQVMDLAWLAPTGFASQNQQGIFEIPFLDRMLLVFLFCLGGMFLFSIKTHPSKATDFDLSIDRSMFKTDWKFAVGAVAVCIVLIALYVFFW